MELDLGAVRAFIAVADTLHFGEAADQLGVSQQAVSQRIAKLETTVGITLFQRSRSGVRLVEPGELFLPQARALVAMADQAVETLRAGSRPLRVDVHGTRLAPTELIRAFHEAQADVEIDIVTSNGLRSGQSALLTGKIDVAFARVVDTIHPSLAHTPACLDPHLVVAGRHHRLAGRRRVRLADLADSVFWLPGDDPDSEWTDFYAHLKHDFGLTIDTTGPLFGLDHMLDEIAGSRDRFIFGGERMRIPWHPGIVQIPVVRPTPLYPWSMLWHRRNRHPALPRLVKHVTDAYQPFDPTRHWLPPADLRNGNFEAAQRGQ